MTACCDIKMRRGWSYCPHCGEYIDWPPTAAERREAARRRKEHEAKMKSDPEYARAYEVGQKLSRRLFDMETRNYERQGDVLVGLSGVPRE